MKKKSSSKKRTSRTVKQPDRRGQSLREHVLYLLKGGGAHISFDDAMGEWTLQLAGVKVANFPHTAWMLLEHMRLAQWDILEFSRNSKHVSPPWPEGYWPKSAAPPDEKAWTASLAAFKKDLRAMERLRFHPLTQLYAPIARGDGLTVFRPCPLLA